MSRFTSTCWSYIDVYILTFCPELISHLPLRALYDDFTHFTVLQVTSNFPDFSIQHKSQSHHFQITIHGGQKYSPIQKNVLMHDTIRTMTSISVSWKQGVNDPNKPLAIH